jgi:hypothetical protein
MLIWLRLALGLAAGLVLLTVLDALGLWALFNAPRPDDADAAHRQSGEFLWSAIFLLVMATALLAAARRGASRLHGITARLRRSRR